MAAIDSLLRLLTSQNADALSLASGEVPRLTRAGEAMPLSMPPIGAALIETFVGELLSPEQREAARSEREVTVEHHEFLVRIAARGSGWSIAAKRRPARARPEPVAAARPRRGAIAPPATPATTAAATPPRPVAPISDSAAGCEHQLERWLRRAGHDDASDLLISSGQPAWIRVGGRLQRLPGDPIDEQAILGLLLATASEAQRAAFDAHGSTDLAFSGTVDGAAVRYRVNLFRQAAGVAASFRPVQRGACTLEALGLPASLHRLVDFPHGLVLVTGPTGSGKSTTLSALIEEINHTAEKHVVTIEDPIEHEYVQDRCLIHQREVGTHVDSFEAGLRAALRESPDLILLGEMRDRATIAAALTAAETGHLVLSTLHAGHAAMAVERIVDVFPEHQQGQIRLQLAQTLRAILTQHLLPAASEGTARVPVIELMIATAGAATMIREGKTHQLASAIQTGRDEGMIPLDRSLADRVEARELTLETAISVTLDGGLQLRELLGSRRRPASGTPTAAPPLDHNLKGPYR